MKKNESQKKEENYLETLTADMSECLCPDGLRQYGGKPALSGNGCGHIQGACVLAG
jgi:hypothetical protein